ncbi:MAG: hypothetical protein ACK5XN_27465, partial [Bacteroidota bacterium]
DNNDRLNASILKTTTDLQNGLTDLTTRVANTEKISNAAFNKSSDAQSSIANINGRLPVVEKGLSDAQNSITALTTQVANHDRVISDNTNSILRLQDATNATNSKFSNFDPSSVIRDISDLKSGSKETTANLSRCLNEMPNLTSGLKNNSDAIDSIHGELDAINTKLNKLDAINAQLSEANAHLQSVDSDLLTLGDRVSFLEKSTNVSVPSVSSLTPETTPKKTISTSKSLLVSSAGQDSNAPESFSTSFATTVKNLGIIEPNSGGSPKDDVVVTDEYFLRVEDAINTIHAHDEFLENIGSKGHGALFWTFVAIQILIDLLVISFFFVALIKVFKNKAVLFKEQQR